MDTTELKAAYAAFLDAARLPGPPGDGWTPERVLAHVAVNDELLLAAAAALAAGRPAPYDNARAVDDDHLARVEAEAGSYEVLLSALRRGAEELIEVAELLDDETAATPVPTRIVDGGEIRIDRPMTLAELLRIHARLHLPGHAAQLTGHPTPPHPPPP